MIEKDIANSDNCQGKQEIKHESPQSEQLSVDDIFSMADKTMKMQNESSKVQFKEKKKKKYGIKGTIITFLLISTIFVVFLVIIGIRSLNYSYPEIKDAFLYQVSSSRSELLKMDDSLLDVDQYYQKQLLLLFSEEDLENMIENVEDIQVFSQMLENGSADNVELIPQDKIDEYNRIVEEYNAALKERETVPENCDD